MEHILIIEDERDVNRLLAQTLKEGGYKTTSAYDGMEGLRMAENGAFDLIMLDLMLPYFSGDEVLRRLREKSNVPVIIISARDMVRTKIDLLTLGADDYITKPFDLGEVLARVVSNLRRCKKEESQQQLTYGNLVLDKEAKTLFAEGIRLDLTAKEYRMMELFFDHPNKVFSKANLYETIWGGEYLGDDNVVKTHISNLRTKLKVRGLENAIETVWGLGYRLNKNF